MAFGDGRTIHEASHMPVIGVNGVDDLLRAGRVRIGSFPPLYGKDPANGEIRGWAADLARALATRIGVEVLLPEFATPLEVLEGLRAGACDLAFMGYDPSRAADAGFSHPIVQFDFTYLVPEGSAIRCVADADRPGLRIAVVRGHASTLALTRTVKQAELVVAEAPDAAFAMLCNGRLDAMAAPRPVLLEYSTKLHGSRVLEDRYGAHSVRMAVPKNHGRRLAYVNGFIEEAKASGLVERAIAHAGWRGVQVVRS